MKLKALHLRKLRYWTIQKGELGTAHTNRDGNEVDYRPLDYIQGRVKRFNNGTFYIPNVPYEFNDYKELYQVPLEFVITKTKAEWNDYLPYETITQIKIVIGENDSKSIPFPFASTCKGFDKSNVISEESKKLYEARTKSFKVKEEPKPNKGKREKYSLSTAEATNVFSRKVCYASLSWKAQEWRWVRRHIQLGSDKAYDQLYELLINLDASLFTQLNKEGVFKDEKGNPSFQDWLIKVLDIEI